jgi:hypothetical protein
MKPPIGLIPVGATHSFELLEGDGSFAVYRKTYKYGRVTYIIVHLPPVQAYTEPPASALVEFSNESEALRTFLRWKEDPLLAQPIGRKKEQPRDPAQCEFDLGPYKTKQQLQFDSLRRHLGGN